MYILVVFTSYILVECSKCMYQLYVQVVGFVLVILGAKKVLVVCTSCMYYL